LPDDETRPNYRRAAILQQKAEFAYQRAAVGTKVDAQESDIYEVLGLKEVSRHEYKGETLAQYPPADGAVFLIRQPGHAIAVAGRDSQFYYFEPMKGLYKFTSKEDYAAQLAEESGSSFLKNWVRIRVQKS
jgi:hypothetical protein